MTSVTSLFDPVEADLLVLNQNLKTLVGARHPILYAAAEHLFGAAGKRMRPAVVLLISRATMGEQEITPRHRRLAEITEMIHTASLVHDDVVDESEVRRGIPTVHTSFDNRIAVLAGDFLFGQAAWHLANLDNLAVVKLLSEVIMNLPEGEIQQGLSRFDPNLSLEAYIEKTYCKTASLFANSAKAAGILSNVAPDLAEALYRFGRHFGLAYQIVDDVLDFTGSTNGLGKPAGSDLKDGNLTAPALFALEEKPYLETLIERQFQQSGDLEAAIGLIQNSQGIQRTRDLAADHAQSAVEYLMTLPPSASRESLANLNDYNLQRLY